MKTLCLLRHAKSSWSEPGLPDIERRLNARGRAAAPLIGAYLVAHDLVPDRVLCSPARRTRETLALVGAAASWRTPVDHPAVLYPGEPGRVLTCIRAADDSIGRLLVIGHNPGLHQLAMALSDDDPTAARKRMAAKFPTAALAVLTFAAESWADIDMRGGTLAAFITPALLTD